MLALLVVLAGQYKIVRGMMYSQVLTVCSRIYDCFNLTEGTNLAYNSLMSESDTLLLDATFLDTHS